MVTVPSVKLLSMLRLANTYLSKPSLVIASFARLLYNLITVALIAPTFVIFLFAIKSPSVRRVCPYFLRRFL